MTDKLVSREPTHWACGCGWRNGFNLIACAACGRLVSEGYGTLMFDAALSAAQVERRVAQHSSWIIGAGSLWHSCTVDRRAPPYDYRKLPDHIADTGKMGNERRVAQKSSWLIAVDPIFGLHLNSSIDRRKTESAQEQKGQSLDEKPGSRRSRAESAPVVDTTMTEDQIKHMVNRFLGWKLPENFNPDAGITFKRDFNVGTPYPMKHEPVGTNLFSADQTEAMIRYLVDGLPTEFVPGADTGEFEKLLDAFFMAIEFDDLNDEAGDARAAVITHVAELQRERDMHLADAEIHAAGADEFSEKWAVAEAKVAELQGHLNRLSGMKFSDRMHAALVSRAEAAEAELASLTADREESHRRWDAENARAMCAEAALAQERDWNFAIDVQIVAAKKGKP